MLSIGYMLISASSINRFRIYASLCCVLSYLAFSSNPTSAYTFWRSVFLSCIFCFSRVHWCVFIIMLILSWIIWLCMAAPLLAVETAYLAGATNIGVTTLEWARREDAFRLATMFDSLSGDLTRTYRCLCSVYGLACNMLLILNLMNINNNGIYNVSIRWSQTWKKCNDENNCFGWGML